MRLPNSPMTEEEFAEAISLAKRGVLVTDNGAKDALLDALLAIAASPSDSALVAAARKAYKANS